MTKSHQHHKKGYSKFYEEDQLFDNQIQDSPLVNIEDICSPDENSQREIEGMEDL
jgi:hypothetical protein